MRPGLGKWIGALVFGGLALVVVLAGRKTGPREVTLVVRQVDTNHSYALLELTNGSRKTIAYAGTVRAPECHWLLGGFDDDLAKHTVQRRSVTEWVRKLPPGNSIVFWARVPAASSPSRIGVIYWDPKDGGELWASAPGWITETFPWLKERHCYQAESSMLGPGRPRS